MKGKAVFCFLYLGIVITGAYVFGSTSIAISPGSEEGVAVVTQSCPTFSWTAVDWAEAYRVAVFEAFGAEVLTFEEMDTMSYPVISKEIRGRALSWTPSSEERLSAGKEFIWYIQALDVYGHGMWSEGRMFKIDVGVNLSEVENKMRTKLKEQGVSDEVIHELLNDMKSGVEDAVSLGADAGGAEDNTDNKVVIQAPLDGEEANNTFFGLNAGADLASTGYHNMFFGNSAGWKTSTGDDNTFMGWWAGLFNITGSDNTFIGNLAGKSNTASGNTFVGNEAGYSNTTGHDNAFMGFQAGYNNVGGINLTFIGNEAGKNNASGICNTFVGNEAGYSTIAGIFNTCIGHQAGLGNESGDANTFIGNSAGVNNIVGHNTFVGHYAGFNNSTGERNTFIGTYAGEINISGHGNTFLGYGAGLSNYGSSNTFVGDQAGYANDTGNANTFVGIQSGRENIDGESNVFLGHHAGMDNESGSFNNFMGGYAGLRNNTGENNVYIGYGAGENNQAGVQNVFVGSGAGSHDGGYYNTFLGYRAGYSNSGEQNIFIGNEAGWKNTGTANTFIGNSSGYNNVTGGSNVFLGNSAGAQETGSGKLYVDNSQTSSPLIWGDFSSDIVAVNGQLGVGTQSPGYPMELERTGTNASIIVDRTDGAMNYINATASFANFGSVRSHPLRLVVNSLWRLRLDSDNSLTMKSGATCTAGGEWQNASSRELKENIRDLTAEEAAEALEGLAPVRFNYKADKQDESVGFIAEDVPDLVATKDRKGMSTMDVVAVLTKVLQEQKETISELKDRIAKLEKR